MERIESLDGSYLSGRSRRKKSKSTKKLKAQSFDSVVEEVEQSPNFDLEDHSEHRETTSCGANVSHRLES